MQKNKILKIFEKAEINYHYNKFTTQHRVFELFEVSENNYYVRIYQRERKDANGNIMWPEYIKTYVHLKWAVQKEVIKRDQRLKEFKNSKIEY